MDAKATALAAGSRHRADRNAWEGASWNHPFWVQDKGWTEAKDLHAGERSVTARSILKGKRPKLQTVSFTGKAQPGYDDPSLVTWDDAQEGTISVARVEEVHRADRVYNIEVEGNHTYFVTEEGVLVHNYSDEAIAYRLQLSEQSKAQLELATANRQAMAELRQTQQEIIARCMPGCLDAQGKFDVNRLSDSDHSMFTSATAGIGQLDSQARSAEKAAAMHGEMRENVYDDGLKPASEQTRELGFFDSMGQRFSNWWDTPGLFNGSFRTDSELISSARESGGIRAEIAMVEKLGYSKTDQQLTSEAMLDVIDNTKAGLIDKYGFQDGVINVRQLSLQDRQIYYRIFQAERNLLVGADLENAMRQRGFELPAVGRRPGEAEGLPEGRGPAAHLVDAQKNINPAFLAFWAYDYPVAEGTPYGPVAPGTVHLTPNHPGYGNQAVVDHGDGVTTLYGHNSQFLVSDGAKVTPDTPIAAVGNTGRSFGSHVHYELRIDGIYVNAMQFNWDRFSKEGRSYVNEYSKQYGPSSPNWKQD